MKKENKLSSDKVFEIANCVFLLILVIIVAYPLYYVLVASISDPYEVYAGKTFLLPSKVTFEGYARVFKEKSIAMGYVNSIYYTVLGTLVSVALIITTGYCVSKKTLPFRKAIMIFYVITMYFGGGLIPTYLVVSKTGLLNSVWSLILPGGVAVYNVIVARTYFESSIPEELYEAASIDGSGNMGTFFKIALPLAKPILAVMVIFTMVAYWNDWFTSLIYMSDKAKYPLQLALR
ncbi:MAG: carbohydrate ABC transporter permease, partial [Lachnospiraceae bacterium]|nr:carbohydrate ABC transporter permease [Lachnospiraceae bacterium]